MTTLTKVAEIHSKPNCHAYGELTGTIFQRLGLLAITLAHDEQSVI